MQLAMALLHRLLPAETEQEKVSTGNERACGIRGMDDGPEEDGALTGP